jgi:uncharacterized protein with HEPN domain
MGEAANKISEDYKSSHPGVPWARLVQLRNFYTHGYYRLTPEEVSGTAKKLVPRVARMIAPLIPQETDDL